MQYDTCRHIKANGLQCKSPAILRTAFCYYHTRLHQRHQPFRHTDATRGYLIPGQHLELVALEDRESVLLSVSMVVNALATGALEPRRGTAILYGLQVAISNLDRLDTQPYAPNVVLTTEPSPEGLDLAEPGTVIEIVEYEPLTEEEEEKLYREEDDDDEEEERPYAQRPT